MVILKIALMSMLRKADKFASILPTLRHLCSFPPFHSFRKWQTPHESLLVQFFQWTQQGSCDPEGLRALSNHTRSFSEPESSLDKGSEEDDLSPGRKWVLRSTWGHNDSYIPLKKSSDQILKQNKTNPSGNYTFSCHLKIPATSVKE